MSRRRSLTLSDAAAALLDALPHNDRGRLASAAIVAYADLIRLREEVDALRARVAALEARVPAQKGPPDV